MVPGLLGFTCLPFLFSLNMLMPKQVRECFQFTIKKKKLMSMCSAFASIQLVFTNRPGLWTFPIPQVHEFKHKHNQCAEINISSRLICSNYIQAHTHIRIHIPHIRISMEMDNIRIIQANRQNQIIPLSYMLRVNLLTFTTLAQKRKRR